MFISQFCSFSCLLHSLFMHDMIFYFFLLVYVIWHIILCNDNIKNIYYIIFSNNFKIIYQNKSILKYLVLINEEVYPVTGVYFLSLTTWWDPQLVSPTNCERGETYTRTRVYFLLINELNQVQNGIFKILISLIMARFACIQTINSKTIWINTHK